MVSFTCGSIETEYNMPSRQYRFETSEAIIHPLDAVKPLLRGWSHAGAAVGAVVLTVALLWQVAGDVPRMVSLLIFGVCMTLLYVVSAVYHIGPWEGRKATLLRALDHANIYLLIAGTYTPICVIVLSGWLRTFVLLLIWTLAVAGVSSAALSLRLPRWATVALYLGMGWVSVIAAPALVKALPLSILLTLLAGGILYTLGAVIYALRWPNPLPRIFGFHEIFHLFVIAGSGAFAGAIWKVAT
jgi:hemolysin III